MLRINRPLAALLITSVALAQSTLAQHGTAAAQGKAPPADAVVGHYRFESGLIMSVAKSRDALTVKQLGQQAEPLKADPDGKFSYANGQAYLTFDLSPQSSTRQGVAETLHVHFDNNTLPAARIDEEVATKAADDLAAKIRNQTHDPACEKTLRRFIEELGAGKPDYSRMTLATAQATRQQLPMLQQRLKTFGALTDVKFKAVGRPTGREQFDVTFEGGRTEWRIQCLANGWIGNIQLR